MAELDTALRMRIAGLMFDWVMQRCGNDINISQEEFEKQLDSGLTEAVKATCQEYYGKSVPCSGFTFDSGDMYQLHCVQNT